MLLGLYGPAHPELAVIWALGLVLPVLALDNGVGRTPIMGYNTWDDFRCDNVTAANIFKVADAIVAHGLHKIGYEYLNIDDCWAVARDNATGIIIEDPQAFPQGMKAVADYVHARGLKFGIYTDRGDYTCEGKPGSSGYEKIDADTYAKWGVDYLKEDSCNAPTDHETAFEQYARMRDALNATGRTVYFALCGWQSWYAPAGKHLANSWRVGYDVNTWDDLYGRAISVNKGLAWYAGPGGFNDIDALLGSTPGAAVRFTPTQSRTQFSLWSIMAAPLIIGSNMLNLSPFDLETFTNMEVVAVNQDPLGLQGNVVWENCPQQPQVVERKLKRALPERGVRSAKVPDCQQIWLKQLHDGFALAFVNFTDGGLGHARGASSGRLPSSTGPLEFDVFAVLGWERAHVRDLWAHEDLGVQSKVNVTLSNGNGESRLFKLTNTSLMAHV